MWHLLKRKSSSFPMSLSFLVILMIYLIFIILLVYKFIISTISSTRHNYHSYILKSFPSFGAPQKSILSYFSCYLNGQFHYSLQFFLNSSNFNCWNAPQIKCRISSPCFYSSVSCLQIPSMHWWLPSLIS